METTSGRPAVTRAQAWALALASAASFMVVLDLLVVATALSTIRTDLHASMGELEWTVNSYTLTFAVFLMTAAAIGDRFGRRRTFAVGLGVFAIGSAACALAPSAGWLIAARAVQGVGAAMVMPLALALLNAAIPAERRGWALGIFGAATALSAVVGPVVGGAVTQGIAWQWIFWLNVPIALIVLPLALSRLSESYGPRAALDLPGLTLGIGAALGLVWGLIRGSTAGWASPEVAGTLAAGAAATIAFTWWESRAAAPMLPMRLFRVRGFAAGNTAIFLFNGSLTGAIFFTAQFLQVGLQQGALAAGLRLLPLGAVPLLVAPWSGRLADRLGERPLVASGLLLQGAGLAWMAVIARPALAYLGMLVPMLIAGLGITLAVPAATRAVVGSVPVLDIGKASGAFTTMRQLGGAFGVAVLAAVFGAAGSYAAPDAFSRGFAPAMAVAAGLALAGAAAGLALPHRPAPAPRPQLLDAASKASQEPAGSVRS